MKIQIIMAVLAVLALAVLLGSMLRAEFKRSHWAYGVGKQRHTRFRVLTPAQRQATPWMRAMGLLGTARHWVLGAPGAEFANMTTENTTGFRTFQATATAIAANVRVKVDSNGLISVAAANEFAIGVTQDAVAASGYGTVKLFSAPGTFLLTASVAITRGAQVYPAASGKIAATGTTALPLVALEAATANGDIIECASGYLGA